MLACLRTWVLVLLSPCLLAQPPPSIHHATITLCLSISQSKRRKAEEEAGDGAESEEETGGFRPYLPMPAALARKRRAKQGSGVPGGNAAVKAQRAVEEWAAKGRCVLVWRGVCGVERYSQRYV